MKGCLRWFAIVALILIAGLVIGPLVLPHPAIPNAVPAEQLADPDGQFIAVNGLRVYTRSMGQGAPALVLLHGLGSSTVSWDDVAGALASRHRVISLDRPGFGLTSRPMRGEWSGASPYGADAQADLIVGLLDTLNVRQAILVGHSAGGTIAAVTALKHPDRVRALVLVDAAIYQGGGAPAWTRPLLATPQMRWYGPLLVRYIFGQRGDRLIASAWYDPAGITPERLAAYRRPLQVANWDRAFWEVTLANRPLNLPARLDELKLPALVITGDRDTWVDTELSLRLAGELPQAELAVIPQCGHVPQEEQPAEFLKAITPFLEKLR
jgi:pimeloyl-ACP methyl ester carboxylesterase